MTGVSIFFFLDARYVGWLVVLLNLFIWFSRVPFFLFFGTLHKSIPFMIPRKGNEGRIARYSIIV